MKTNRLIDCKYEATRILRALKEGKHLDIYGPIGIGKTTLLRFIFNEIKSEKLVPIYIKLSTAENFPKFLETIAEGIDDTFQQEKYLFTFREYVDKTEEYYIDRTVNLFSAALNTVTKFTSIALCFDDTEKVPSEIWKEFEENILRFHLGIGDGTDSKLQIITAGQSRMQWNFFRMREQVEACRLDLFDRESTREMVQVIASQQEIDLGIKNKQIIEDIYSLTLGHPKSIKLIITHWKELQVDDNKYQKAIATLLIKKYIQPEFINQVKELVEGEQGCD